MSSNLIEPSKCEGTVANNVRIPPPVDVRLRDLGERILRLRNNMYPKREHLDTLRQIGESQEGYHVESPGVLRLFVAQVHQLILFIWGSLEVMLMAFGDIHLTLVAIHKDRARLAASMEEFRQGWEAQRASAAKGTNWRQRGQEGTNSEDCCIEARVICQTLEDRVRVLEKQISYTKQEQAYQEPAANSRKRARAHDPGPDEQRDNTNGMSPATIIQYESAPNQPQHHHVGKLPPGHFSSVLPHTLRQTTGVGTQPLYSTSTADCNTNPQSPIHMPNRIESEGTAQQPPAHFRAPGTSAIPALPTIEELDLPSMQGQHHI